METLILLTIILFVFYFIVSKKKNNFVVTEDKTIETDSKLKILLDAIEKKIQEKEITEKQQIKKIIDAAKKTIDTDESVNKEDNTETKYEKPEEINEPEYLVGMYREPKRDKNDVYYSFKVLNDKIYYSNILQGCKRKNVIENINESYSLYSYIFNLIEELLIYSNKNNKTTFTVINIEKFKRQKIGNKIIYIIEPFLLDYKKYISHKFSFHLELENNVVQVKKIKILNAKLPQKRFTCEDSNHCSGRNSSLKLNDDIDNVNGISNTSLEHSLSDIKERTQHTNLKEINNLKNHIVLNNEYDKSSFPCKQINHTWDTNGVSNSHDSKNNCFGSNYSVETINQDPFFHVSMFSNYNYGNISENINDNFRWNNLVGFDKT